MRRSSNDETSSSTPDATLSRFIHWVEFHDLSLVYQFPLHIGVFSGAVFEEIEQDKFERCYFLLAALFPAIA